MRDDKKLVVGDPPKEYDYKKFSDILNRIEVFANSIMAAGPARLSAIDTTGMPTSGTGLRDNAVYNHNGVLVVQPATGVDADTLGGHDPSYYGAALGYTPVNKAGDTMTGGLSFGATAVASPTDVTRHIALWGGQFGFSISNNAQNYVVNSTSAHHFYVGASNSLTVDSGLIVGVPTGGDPGAGKVNAVDYQINGTSISSLYVAATDYTAADVLTKIKTVDGSGSGLDADTLDGHDTAYFQTALGYTPANVAGDTFTGAVTFQGNSTAITGPGSGNVSIELGGHGYTNFAFIDFHTGATDVDYDSRIIASGGSGVAGGGTLAFTGAHFGWNTAPTFGSDLVNKTYADSLPLAQSYESAQQTITSAGLLTLAHGLGARPKVIQTTIKCQTAENGYSVGDEVNVEPINNCSDGTSRANSITADATNIYYRFSSTATCYLGANKTTGGTAAFTNANWKLIVRAWL